jgi:hypothetical protein
MFKVSEVAMARTPDRQNWIYDRGISTPLNTQVRIAPLILKIRSAPAMADGHSDDEIDDEHERLLNERHSRYCGTARIPLNRLQLDAGLNFNIDERNIERIVDIFQREQVKRLKPDNFAIALVKRDDLERCLRESNLSISALVQDVNLPTLKVPEGLSFRVLDGRHRLLAAQRFLKVEQGLWWSVKIYDDRTSVSTSQMFTR